MENLKTQEDIAIAAHEALLDALSNAFRLAQISKALNDQLENPGEVWSGSESNDISEKLESIWTELGFERDEIFKY